MNSHKWLYILALVAALLLLASNTPAYAERTDNVYGHIFVVKSIADEVDNNVGDGKCKSASGKCTLRAAVQESNALAGKDRIYLPAGGYKMQISGGGLFDPDETGATGDYDIRDDLEIWGAGTGQTIIDGNSLHRLFQVYSSDTTGAALLLRQLTVRKGETAFTEGGGAGIYNANGVVTLDHVTLSANTANRGPGGGIYNGGTLNMYDSTIQNNAGSHGGGISNTTDLIGGNAFAKIVRSTIYYNSVYGDGGGIKNDGGLVTLVDSTIAFNTALEHGGGIYNDWQKDKTNYMSLIHSTVTRNSADQDQEDGGAGGGIFNVQGAGVWLHSTILAGNFDKTPGQPSPHADCLGVLATGGYNLVGSSSGCTGFANGIKGDHVGASNALLDPKLQAPNSNGGATNNFMPLSNSPARNAGDADYCLNGAGAPTTDQRGYARSSGACDIGSVEADSTCVKPAPTALYTPALKQRIKQAKVIFNWYKVECADTYRVMVRQDSPKGVKVFKQKNIVGTGITPTPLAAGHKYFVVVRVCHAAKCTKSEKVEFRVK